MTISDEEFAVDQPQHYEGPVIPVEMVRNAVLERPECAERVSYNKYSMVGSGGSPTIANLIKIAPDNPKRKRIQVMLLGQTNAPALTINYDPSLLMAGQGWQFQNSNGTLYEFENQRALWAVCMGPTNATASVCVADEYYS